MNAHRSRYSFSLSSSSIPGTAGSAFRTLSACRISSPPHGFDACSFCRHFRHGQFSTFQHEVVDACRLVRNFVGSRGALLPQFEAGGLHQCHFARVRYFCEVMYLHDGKHFFGGQFVHHCPPRGVPVAVSVGTRGPMPPPLSYVCSTWRAPQLVHVFASLYSKQLKFFLVDPVVYGEIP